MNGILMKKLASSAKTMPATEKKFAQLLPVKKP